MLESIIIIGVNGLCLLLLLGFVFYTIIMPFFSAPFYASSNAAMLKMLELAHLTNTDKVVDLGSGDGRLVIAASRLSKEAVGVEHNPYLTLLSRIRAIISPNGKLKIKNKSLWHENLATYDVVFCYLFPSYMEKLKQKFEKELAPGSRIVTNTFRIKGWQESANIDGRYHLYIIGKHK